MHEHDKLRAQPDFPVQLLLPLRGKQGDLDKQVGDLQDGKPAVKRPDPMPRKM